MPDLSDLVEDLLGAAPSAARARPPLHLPSVQVPSVAQTTRRRAARTVGRDPLAAAGRDLLAVEARHLALVGEPGLGKTRVLGDLVAEASAAGLRVAQGRGVGGGRGDAYRPMAEIASTLAKGSSVDERLWPHRAALGRLVPEWSEHATSGPISGFVVAEAIAALVESSGSRTLLVVDDLQWADDESLDVLDALLRRAGPAAYAIALATRPGGPLEEAMGRWDADGAVTVWHLGPLTGPDVVALAQEIAGDRLPPAVTEAITDRSDGVPLVVEELVNALLLSGSLRSTDTGLELADDTALEQVPSTLAASVAQRLSGLEAPALLLARVAALIGREFRSDEAGSVAGLAADDVRRCLDQLLEAQVVERLSRVTEVDHRFVHALTQEAVLAQLPSAELADLAAEVLERGIVQEVRAVDLERRASLLLVAGRPEEAVKALRRAAAASLADGALASAERQLRRALTVPRTPVTGAAVDLLEVLATAGRTAAAAELGTSLVGVAQGDDLIRLHLALARLAETVGDVPSALEHVEQSVAAGAGGPALELVRSRVLLADRRLAEGQTAAVSALRQHHTPDESCEALELLARCARTSDASDAEALLERLAELAEAHGLGGWQLRALSELGSIDLLRLADGERLVAARELATARGDLQTATVVGYHEAIRRFHAVELDSWAAWIDQVESEAAAYRLGHLADALRVLRIAFLALGGDPTRAQELAEEAAQAHLDPDREASLWGVARTTLALLADDRDRAAEHAVRGVAAVADREFGDPSPMWGTHALLGTIAGAGSELVADVRRRGTTVNRVNEGLARWCDAVLLGRDGSYDDAGDAALQSIELLAPAPFYSAIALRHVVPLATTQGWTGPWEAHAQSAAAYLLGQGYDAPGRALETALGRPATASRPDDGITKREREVLDQLRQGLTNAEIAERLVISPRTVEKHVERLLAKTGAANRTQLAMRPR